MTIADRGQPVEVNVGDCRCPGSPHALDTVWLKPELDVPLAIAANAAVRPILQMFATGEIEQSEAIADVEAVLSGIYLRHAIESWTFTDERGLPVPIRPGNTRRLLPYGNGGEAVVEAADGLYAARISAPFIEAGQAMEKAMADAEKARLASLNREQRRAMKKSSANGQTATSTSAIRTSGLRHPEPSAPSSPTSSEAGKPYEVQAL